MAADGGFRHGAQEVVTLFEDVKISMNRFKHVPIKMNRLTSLASKLDEGKAARANFVYGLTRDVVAEFLGEAVNNCSNQIPLVPQNADLDAFDGYLRASEQSKDGWLDQMGNHRHALRGRTRERGSFPTHLQVRAVSFPSPPFNFLRDCFRAGSAVRAFCNTIIATSQIDG